MRDGVAFGFFDVPFHLQILKNRLNALSSRVPTLLEVFVLDTTGAFEGDSELVSLMQKARNSGMRYMIEIIYGASNHQAATTLRDLMRGAREPPYSKTDLAVGGVYYKRGSMYARLRSSQA